MRVKFGVEEWPFVSLLHANVCNVCATCVQREAKTLKIAL